MSLTHSIQTSFLSLVLWVAAAVVLMWIALWNGSPIFFGDTLGYFNTAITGDFSSYRPSAYPLILLAAVWTGSFMPVLILQAGVTSWLLLRMVQWDFEMSSIPSFMTVVLIAMTTTLPWWVSTLMADLWAAVTALAVYHLIFHWERQGIVERCFMCLTLLIGIMSHISAVLITAVVLLVTLSAVLATNRSADSRPALRPGRTAVIAAMIMLGGLFFPLSNLAKNDTAVPADGAARLILARVITDGLVLGMLEERCDGRPPEPYALCPYRDELRRYLSLPEPENPYEKCPCSTEGYVNWMLNWDTHAPLKEVYVENGADDARRLLSDSFLYNPAGHITAVLEGTWDIFGNAGVTPFIDGRTVRVHHLRNVINQESLAAVEQSRAVKGELGTRTVNRLLLPLVWAGGAMGVAATLLSIFGRGLMDRLPAVYRTWCRNAAYCLLFTLTNAMIMYAAVGDHTRYQSRCSWLVAMQPSVIAMVWLGRRGRARSRDRPTDYQQQE